MTNVVSIGLDIAKNVFQVHGAGVDGDTLFNRQLRRGEVLTFFEALPPCLVGLEACSTAHHWAQSITALGHDVRLIAPQYVKPFVKRGKTDANDAAAINEALTRKTMHFVQVRSASERSTGVLFKVRALFVRQKAQAVNALRSHMAEFGIIAARGACNVKVLAKEISAVDEKDFPAAVRSILEEVLHQIEVLQQKIDGLNQTMRQVAQRDEAVSRLMSIPGVGPVTAMAIRALAPHPTFFKSARHFSAWLGLTPKSHSSGGTKVIGPISKMGHSEIRSLLVIGAMSVIRNLKKGDRDGWWIARLSKRRPFKVAAVALANKTARVVWALLVNGGTYRNNPVMATKGERH